jgi:hypothetical protein
MFSVSLIDKPKEVRTLKTNSLLRDSALSLIQQNLPFYVALYPEGTANELKLEQVCMLLSAILHQTTLQSYLEVEENQVSCFNFIINPNRTISIPQPRSTKSIVSQSAHIEVILEKK